MKKLSILFLGLVLLSLPVVMVAAAGTWADYFDSYLTGTSLHGVGGWKGWNNNPAFTAFTTNAQSRSLPNSMDISGNADMIHEFAISSGFYYLRFYQYIPSSMSGTSYFIMLNQYDDACATCNWSVQVQFQGATGLMIDDGSGASMPFITDQWGEVCLEIDLTQDTQAFLYNGALLYTGSWSNHISGGGTTSIGAVDMFANGATSIYYDDMSLGPGTCLTVPMPFDLYLPIVAHN